MAEKKERDESLRKEMQIRETTMNACFSDANAFRGRYRVLMGGAGSGKSSNLAQDYLLKLLDSRHEGANLLVVRKAAKRHKESTFPEFMAAAQRICGEKANEYFRFTKEPLRVECLTTGNQVLFAGVYDGKARESLKSIQASKGKICWIWCEEATELSEGDFEILDDRLRGMLPDGLFYQISLSFNPTNGGHWLRKRFFDRDEDRDVLIHQSSYRDNRFIDPNYAARMERRAQNDPEGYQVYALGEWGVADVAQILKHYEVKQCSKDPNDYEAMALGCDFGYNHPNATLLLGKKDNEIFICQELILRERDGEEIAAEMLKQFSREHPLWCDSAEPDRIRRLGQLGWRAQPVKKGTGSVNAQIDYLKRKKLIVDPSCQHTLEELRDWRWQRDRITGELLDIPVLQHDDAMAALRYGVEGWRKQKGSWFE